MGCMQKLEWNATGRSKFASSSHVTAECRSYSGWRWPYLLRLLRNVKNQSISKKILFFWLSSSKRQINKFLPIWSCTSHFILSNLLQCCLRKMEEKILKAFRRAETALCPDHEVKAWESLFPSLYTPFGKSWQKSNFRLPLSHTEAALFFANIFSTGGGERESQCPSL